MTLTPGTQFGPDAFLRCLYDEQWLVILNFTADVPVFALPSTIDFHNTS